MDDPLEDPWSSGWATLSAPLSFAAETTTTTPTSSNTTDPVPIDSPPSTYTILWELTHLNLVILSDENHVLTVLVDNSLLSPFQKDNIIDACVSLNLTSTTDLAMIFFALTALELESPGQANADTLKSRKDSLPQIPEIVMSLFTPLDPLSDQLANTTLSSEWHQPRQSADDDGFLPEPEPLDAHAVKKYFADQRANFDPLVNSNDTIRIREVPEKEGIVFKHINYVITHDLRLGVSGPIGTKKVIRRYSDFSWYVLLLLLFFLA